MISMFFKFILMFLFNHPDDFKKHQDEFESTPYPSLLTLLPHTPASLLPSLSDSKHSGRKRAAK